MSLDRDKRLLCNLSINGSLFFSFMMVCIILTLSGNGPEAQLKHLMAACLKGKRESEKGAHFWNDCAAGDPAPLLS